jgi:prolycopene isomerase
MRRRESKYDAVIIGAGISGLVCGCYLARAGMKVLLIEQHHRPGGYCTSFKRKSFTFDAAVHSFGSYRKGGIMNSILTDLNVNEKLRIKRYDPSDILLAPGYKISFWADIQRTVQELQEAFPKEAAGITKFFYFLQHAKPFELATLRNKTFDDFLNLYVHDERLKAILSFPILGNGGLPSKAISAFTAVILYTEFYLDGGYYPEKGMQALPDTLAAKFLELEGELQLSCAAKKIHVVYNKVDGVILQTDEIISSKYVISCCDARQTFLNLLAPQAVPQKFQAAIREMQPSPSFFIAYLGMVGELPTLLTPGVSVWVMPDFKIEETYSSYVKGDVVDNSSAFMIRVPPDNKSLQAFIIASYKTKNYWRNNKYELLDSFIKRIDRVFPGLSSHIRYKEAATPHTLNRYTLNYRGAAYGWASTPTQLFSKGLTQTTPVENLYLAGHWTTQTQGVSGVAYTGQETAKLILRKENRLRPQMPS